MSLAENKYSALVERLRLIDGALVAFSGGVDSALLLFAARDALGERAVAAFGRSPSVPAGEEERAVETARQIGARLVLLESDELADPLFRQNTPDRCFHCKRALFRALLALARREQLAMVLEGSNSDDLDDFRPGMRAAHELGIRAPLLEAGLSKTEIRSLARARGLSVWDKPSLACLASRIPYGSPITEERLARIDRAESLLRRAGFERVRLRVRDHDDIARIEIDAAAIDRLLDAELRDAIVAGLKQLGYRYVALDLEGYRIGAMNEVLPAETGQQRSEEVELNPRR